MKYSIAWSAIVCSLQCSFAAAGPVEKADAKYPMHPEAENTMSTRLPAPPITYTYVTPHPSAEPIPITRQNQWVTSYYPALTLCPLVTRGPNAKRQLLPTGFHFTARNATKPTSTVGSGTGTDVGTGVFATATFKTPETICRTIYSTTLIPICHTTLTPLGNLPITITDCTEQITFSTDHGLDTRAAAGTGKPDLLTTKYHARWSSVITGVPKGTVTADVCYANGECSTYYETWGTRLIEAVSTETSTLRVSEIVSGPTLAIISPFLTLPILRPRPTTLNLYTTWEVARTSASKKIIPFTVSTSCSTSTRMPTHTGTGYPTWPYLTDDGTMTIFQTITQTETITLKTPTRSAKVPGVTDTYPSIRSHTGTGPAPVRTWPSSDAPVPRVTFPSMGVDDGFPTGPGPVVSFPNGPVPVRTLTVVPLPVERTRNGSEGEKAGAQGNAVEQGEVEEAGRVDDAKIGAEQAPQNEAAHKDETAQDGVAAHVGRVVSDGRRVLNLNSTNLNSTQ